MSVEEMVSKEGKDSSGNSTRPIDAAATLIDTSDENDTSEYEKKSEINKNKLKIIIYLANNGAKGVKLYGEPILFACTENNLKAVKAMIKAHDANNTKMTGNKKMSVEDMLKYKWVNKSTADQWTLLQFAIKCTTTYDNLDIVKYLVETYPTVDLIGQMDDKQWNSHIMLHSIQIIMLNCSNYSLIRIQKHMKKTSQISSIRRLMRKKHH